jgi:hypothetical protein
METFSVLNHSPEEKLACANPSVPQQPTRLRNQHIASKHNESQHQLTEVLRHIIDLMQSKLFLSNRIKKSLPRRNASKLQQLM